MSNISKWTAENFNYAFTLYQEYSLRKIFRTGSILLMLSTITFPKILYLVFGVGLGGSQAQQHCSFSGDNGSNSNGKFFILWDLGQSVQKYVKV